MKTVIPVSILAPTTTLHLSEGAVFLVSSDFGHNLALSVCIADSGLVCVNHSLKSLSDVVAVELARNWCEDAPHFLTGSVKIEGVRREIVHPQILSDLESLYETLDNEGM